VAQPDKKCKALSRKRAQPKDDDPELESIVREIIARVADSLSLRIGCFLPWSWN